MTPRLIILFLLFTLFSCSSPKSDVSHVASNEDSGPVPEWFVATGDWFEEPRLYVRTVGHGTDTVVSKWREINAGGPFYNPKADQLTSSTIPFSGWDYLADFQKSGIPVSIIVGDHDFLDMGGQVSQKWSNGIPNVKVNLIEKAGHQIWTDEPEKFRTNFDGALMR